ncbi:MAG: NADH-quinone oxidoreductase subunit NuoD [Candidatus Omnitrophica bacterium CG11_big_fil_rev_8_21_14_0_20_45_26]|uniref:NADH-quinone oxidoreductase subunit D n=1 Tax=Candidatus Abzuiibacterium crystallinum TaxID=1974748 RepID=A0A2H0LT31_9BACT|nr:MAG: NADH-quinone oxidoreductase subunit NuoD [Candidatus Omnitrophica bacterium CG11_big_fil_rev_8_21_14_0_20_45_26]PIW65433.1 MAG: NADH-quinone oxidoreductase subunit NuoD [Candidatus Omnitrophica bacterium CG12_big_fil_rev_8_21_14_0_65_45_16]
MSTLQVEKSEIFADPSGKELKRESMMLNMGPSHPAMHGIIRLILELDGERVLRSEVEIGYLHRAFEKMSESMGYLQVFPYTDRLNYSSPLINNAGYAMAVEKLFDIRIPERARYIRVLMCELSRICDHLTCIAASAMELGAFTVFLYMIKARENLWNAVEMITGARLTISYMRVGGVKADLPEDFEKVIRTCFKETRHVLKECHGLLTRNRIFVDRVKGVGVISKEDALAYGITGPFLRSTGVDYDVRKDAPYLGYDEFDFEVPVGTTGDNYDRYLVRMEEMEQSMRIVEQAFQAMPGGALAVNLEGKEIPAAEMVDEAKMGMVEGFQHQFVTLDPTLEGSTKFYFDRIQAGNKSASLPAKENTYGNIEGLMQHFKIIMDGHGYEPPKGEVYQAVEGGNGELGFYLVSDGTGRPYRVRVRPPCFPIMAALPLMLEGGMLADIIATFGSVNMIGGELDR